MQTLKVFVLRWYYRLANYLGWRRSAPQGGATTLEIPVEGGPLAARIYAGTHGASQPLILYFHGGGWVIGDLQTHHYFCANLAAASGCTVVAVDYRLAPEHRFPTAHDDCLAAAQWLVLNREQAGPSNGSIVLAGDSAGGNLAVCTALDLGPDAGAAIAGVLSIYPVSDHYRSDFASYTERAKGQALTRDLMAWFWDTYLGDTSPDNPALLRALPLRNDRLASLPPLLLVTAERDPLRDEGIALAERCREAGVSVDYRHYPDAEHGFACSEGETENFRNFLAQVRAWLAGLGAHANKA